MSYPVESLEPKAVWKYFDKIRQIPHGSKNEAALGKAILEWAKERGHEGEMDAAGNVIVRIPATPGLENAPVLVLQGHLDMVCEKNTETEFDFENDPIVLRRDKEWIGAEGTTLGADNGIGVATGLAFMDVDVEHGPLELLMTVDEETGLNGAMSLQPDFVKGRMLFNLDSEEDGIFYVGCAGGRDATVTFPVTMTSPTHQKAFELNLKGLRGGHSGLDIIHNRGNAIRLVARALKALKREIDFELASLEGGDKHNAIAREARAIILIESADQEKLNAIVAAQLAGFRTEFASHEPELALTLAPLATPEKIFEQDSAKKILAAALAIPHGVQSMVRDLLGMVETSTNMARLRLEQGQIEVLCASRSSVAPALQGVIDQIEAVGEALGAETKVGEGYPGWMPNMDSKMLAKAKEIWLATHGEDAQFQVIHAGLECGIIGEKYPGMDMISLGPTIINPHSPGEMVSIPSVDRFFKFVLAFVGALART